MPQTNERRDVGPPVRHAHSGVTYRRTHVAPLASKRGYFFASTFFPS